jgi:hypothetical protein
MEGGIHDETFLLILSNVALGPSLSRSSYKLSTSSTICNLMHTRVLLSFFVTVENKKLVNPTPKRKVARWNRAGGTTFATEIEPRIIGQRNQEKTIFVPRTPTGETTTLHFHVRALRRLALRGQLRF